MPQMTAAADTYASRPQDYYDLPQHLRDLCEAANALRSAWETLDECGHMARQSGRHNDAHDLRNPEQQAYLAWQAAEMAFRQIMSQLVSHAESEAHHMAEYHGDAAYEGLPGRPATAADDLSANARAELAAAGPDECIF